MTGPAALRGGGSSELQNGIEKRGRNSERRKRNSKRGRIEKHGKAHARIKILCEFHLTFSLGCTKLHSIAVVLKSMSRAICIFCRDLLTQCRAYSEGRARLAGLSLSEIAIGRVESRRAVDQEPALNSHLRIFDRSRTMISCRHIGRQQERQRFDREEARFSHRPLKQRRNDLLSQEIICDRGDNTQEGPS